MQFLVYLGKEEEENRRIDIYRRSFQHVAQLRMYTPHHSVLYLLPPGSLFVAVSFTFWFILALELLYSNSNAISIISLDLVLGSFELWARARWMDGDG